MATINRRGFLAMIAGGLAIAATSNALAAHMGDGTPMAGGTPGAMPMGGTAAGFMTITNTGKTDDQLLSAETDVAKMAEIHEMKDMNGVMKMSPLPDGLPLPAGETVELKPGGYHVMLFGLKHDLRPGDSYELKLTFEQAGDVTLTVPVYASETAFKDAEKKDPVIAGDLEIAGIWTRMAPALMDPSATPAH